MSARRRHRNGADVPLTAEDAQAFLHVSSSLERQYRRADSNDAEITRMRMTRGCGGIVKVLTRAIRAAVQS